MARWIAKDTRNNRRHPWREQHRRDEHRGGDVGEGRPIGVRARQKCLRSHQQQHRHGESQQQALRLARRCAQLRATKPVGAIDQQRRE